MSRHIIKRIDFLGRNVPILLQNKNGPCPLLAIANVLLLRGHIEIPITFTEVSIDQVIQLIATRIFDANSNTNMNADLQKNIDDVISILPALQKGLDLNVKFRHTKDYEFTREIATFDILGINLVHGWICDSDDESLINVLGAKSYNELVEKIINYQSAEQEYLNSKKKKIINEQGYDDENNETSSSTNNSNNNNNNNDDDNNNNNIKDVEDNNNNTPTTIKKDEDDVKEKGNDNAKNINTMTKNPIIDAKIVDDLVVIEQQNGNNNNNNTTVVDGQKIIDDDENVEEEEEEEDDGGKNQAIVEKEADHQLTKITENNINNNKTYENKVNHKDQTTTTEITNDETTTTTQEEDPQLLEAIELSRKATLKKEFEQNNTTIMFNGNKVNLFKMSQDSTIIQNFFSKTASQLTMTGLFKLHEEVRNNELCVFFRNNHFSTLLKRDGKIFLLLTDLGFEQQQNFVWEVLDGIDGDTTLATSKFKKAPPVANREQIYDAAVDFASNFDFSNNNNSNTANNNYNGTNNQNNPNYNNTDNNPPSFTRQYSEEDDLALAMQLQQQEEEHNRLATTATTTTTTTNIHGNDNRRYVQQQQQQQQQQQRQQQRNGGYNLADQQAELDRLKQEHLKRQQQQRRQQQQQRQQQGRGKGKGRRSGNSSNCCIQ